MPKMIFGSFLQNGREQLIREIAGRIDEQGCRFAYLVPTAQLQKEVKTALFQHKSMHIQREQGGTGDFALPDPYIYLFDGLVNEILKDWWEYQPPLQTYQSRMILQMVTEELDQSGKLSVLQRMVQYDGFYTSLFNWLQEVKKTGQTPADWLSLHPGPTKEHDLGLIYQQYESFLRQHQLMDQVRNYEQVIQGIYQPQDGQESSLLDQLELVVVDGFSRLNMLQIRLLKSLIHRGVELWVHLLQDEGRKDLFLSAGEMVAQLEQMAHGAEWDWQVEEVFADGVGEGQRRPDLDHLCQNLFNLSAKMQDGDEGIQILQMPDPYQEMEQIGRLIKQTLLDADAEDLPLDQIAVILRNVDYYHFYIEGIFHQLGLPYQISVGTPLTKTPIFKLIVKVYQLLLEDWSRESFLQILKSPYLKFTSLEAREELEKIEEFEHLILEAGIIKGRSEWLTRLKRFARRLQVELQRELAKVGAEVETEMMISSDQLTTLLAEVSDQESKRKIKGLVRKLELLRELLPVLEPLIKRLQQLGKKQSLREHSQALWQFLTDYQLAQQVVSIQDDQHQVLRRDLVSLDQLQSLIQELIHFGELLNGQQEAGEVQQISEKDFLYYLKEGAGEVHLPEPKVELDAIQILTPSMSRGRKFKYVFIAGLVEGEFPYYGHKDWLFKPEERKLLKEQGIHFPQFYERLEEERLFFLEAVGTATERLFLTCPALESDEKVHASSFIEEVGNLFTEGTIQRRELIAGGFSEGQAKLAPLTRQELDESYLKECWNQQWQIRTAEVEVASAAEAEGQAEDLLNLPGFSQTSADKISLTLADQLTPDEMHGLDELYLRGEMIQLREGIGFSQYDGLLYQREIQAALAKDYHSERVYSISELNTYAICPFQFFGNRILRLEQVEEPTLRLEPLDLGNLYHQILYLYFKDFSGWEAETIEEGKARLAEIATQEMADYLPGESLPEGLWSLYQEEIITNLQRVLTYEYEEAEKQNYEMVPTHLEASFGRLKETYQEKDSLNLSEPVVLHREMTEDAEGEVVVKFKGKIDRIDLSRDGRYLIIYDYKFGSRDGFGEMEAGIDLQLPIYIKAAELLCGADKEILGAGYFSLLKCDRKSGIWRDSRQDLIPVTSRSKSCIDEESWQGMLRQTDQYIIDYVQRIRRGDFRVNPAKCPDYCKFKKICRYDQTRIRLKQRKGGGSDEL